MKYIKSMEKFFLRGFLTNDELHIINKQYIYGSVFLTKLGHGSCITTTDRFDYFVGKLLWSNIENLHIRILFQYEMSNGMHKVSLTKSGTAI